MSNESQGKSVLVQGRIVWCSGDLFKGRVKTEFNSKTIKLNQRGEPMNEYGFGLAVPKTALAAMGPGEPGHIWAAMHEEAYTLYPSRQLPPAFAMKYKDGDGIDDKGISFAQRKGYAGHIVFGLTTSLPIKFFKFEGGQNIQVNEGIKCGDYVNVQVSIKAHGPIGQGKPGLYLNPNAVQLIGYGEEIVNAPSGDQVFGTQAPPLPQGASAMPLAPQPGQMLVPQPMPTQQFAQGAPNYGVLPQQFQPQATMQPAFQQQPVAPVYQQPPMPGVAAPAGFPVPR